MMKTILQGLGKLVFPPICVLCKSKRLHHFPREVLCFSCENLIQKNIPPFCPQCSRHLHLKNYLTRCPSCSQHEFHFDFAWSPLIYNDHLKNLIHAFKYHQKTYLKFYFVHHIMTFIQTYQLDIQQFDLIIPVPLHTTRLRERGYNQSELIAALLSREFAIPLHGQNLIKARHTPNQAIIKRKERFTNLKGAFRIKHSKMIFDSVGKYKTFLTAKNSFPTQPIKYDERSEEFYGKKILIVDDLITTGITASEISQTLKSAGAKKVAVLAAAIA